MIGSPARVFAALIPADNNNFVDENEPSFCRIVKRPTPERHKTGGEVQVTGSAELSSPPDRALLCISISNCKETVNDVTNSITRRLEYVLQTLRQHEIKEDDITVTKDIRREDNSYYMEAEVNVVFTDFVKMQGVSNTLVEKLDRTVSVGTPQFHHSAECLAELRRRACLAAVSSGQRKAREVCGLVGQVLGRPLLIREEDTKESSGETEEATPIQPLSLQQRIRRATVSVSTHVFVSFEIKGRERPRKRH